MYILESKNYGTLYHFTDEEGLNGIIDSGGLISNFYDYISFTRSFVPPRVGHLENRYVRLAYNGNKLSNKYKINPFLDKDYSIGRQHGSESEEIIKWPERKLLKVEFALIRIDILKKSEMKEFTKSEIEFYKKIKLPIFFVDNFKPVK